MRPIKHNSNEKDVKNDYIWAMPKYIEFAFVLLRFYLSMLNCYFSLVNQCWVNDVHIGGL